MDTYFLKLSWKNIGRNRRRTGITVGAIAFGVMALVCIQNYYDAFHEQLVQNAIRFHGGHLMIAAPESLNRQSAGLYIAGPDRYSTWLRARPEIQGWSERVTIQGLISSSRGSANVMFVGVDPERERKVTRFATSLREGRFLDSRGEHEIVVGTELSKNLRVSVGSKIVALTQGVDGSIGNELFRIVGLMETRSEADRSIAFVSLDVARQLASLPGSAVNEIAILLDSSERLDEVRNRYARDFPRETDERMYSWMEAQPHVVAMIDLDRAVNRLVMGVILLVAALGIGNTILMCLMERTREFGVMMAMGTTRWEFIKMTLLETLCLTFVGVFAGNFLGAGVTAIFGWTGFDLAWISSKKLVIHGALVQTVSYPSIHWETSAMVTGTIFLLALGVAVLPARYISNLSPVGALRFR